MIGKGVWRKNCQSKVSFAAKIPVKRDKKWKVIHALFCISAIFSIHDYDHFGISAKVAKAFSFTFNILLILHHVTINVSFLAISPGSARGKGNIALSLAALAHRLVLCTQASSIEGASKTVAKLSQKLNLAIKDDKESLFKIWTVISTLTYLLIFVTGVVICYTYGTTSMTFNYSIGSPFMEMLYVIAYMASWTLYLILPINTFALYYSMSCRQLQCIVESFKNTLNPTPPSEYHLVLRRYISIRKLVIRMESDLSLPMFTTTAFNACTMFFAVISVLHPDEFGGIPDLVTVWALFLVSYAGFLGVTVTGSLLSESGSGVWSHAQDVLSGEVNKTCAQKQFLAVAEKGLDMTCWKIVP